MWPSAQINQRATPINKKEKEIKSVRWAGFSSSWGMMMCYLYTVVVGVDTFSFRIRHLNLLYYRKYKLKKSFTPHRSGHYTTFTSVDSRYLTLNMSSSVSLLISSLSNVCLSFMMDLQMFSRLLNSVLDTPLWGYTHTHAYDVTHQTHVTAELRKHLQLTSDRPETCHSRNRSRWAARNRDSRRRNAPWLHPEYEHWNANRPDTENIVSFSKPVCESLLH